MESQRLSWRQALGKRVGRAIENSAFFYPRAAASGPCFFAAIRRFSPTKMGAEHEHIDSDTYAPTCRLGGCPHGIRENGPCGCRVQFHPREFKITRSSRERTARSTTSASGVHPLPHISSTRLPKCRSITRRKHIRKITTAPGGQSSGDQFLQHYGNRRLHERSADPCRQRRPGG